MATLTYYAVYAGTGLLAALGGFLILLGLHGVSAADFWREIRGE